MNDFKNKINLRTKKLIIIDLTSFLYKYQNYLNYIKKKYPFIDKKDLLTSLLTVYDSTKMDHYERNIDKVIAVYYLDKENLEEDIEFITALECMYVGFLDYLFDIWNIDEDLVKLFDYDKDTLEPMCFIDKNSVIFKVV